MQSHCTAFHCLMYVKQSIVEVLGLQAKRIAPQCQCWHLLLWQNLRLAVSASLLLQLVHLALQHSWKAATLHQHCCEGQMMGMLRFSAFLSISTHWHSGAHLIPCSLVHWPQAPATLAAVSSHLFLAGAFSACVVGSSRCKLRHSLGTLTLDRLSRPCCNGVC